MPETEVQRGVLDRTTELSEEVLESVESGQRAGQLVHTEYDFLRKATHSAGKAARRPDDER
jgi:hypothetical protein